MSERPKFLPSFIDLLKRESELSGFRALIPFRLILCLAAGGAAGYWMPNRFWEDANWGVSTTVYGGLLTFSGLVLALGWSAFSRIYETLFRGEFGGYLHEKGLLNDYLVHISFMHTAQVLSVAFSGSGLLLVLLDLPWIWFDRLVLSCVLSALVYGLKQAVDAVTIMNDLAWNSAIFEKHQRTTPSSQNVVKAFAPK